MRMNSPKGKELLAMIRRGDYAHPGEEEAINLVFKHRKPEAGCRILDAGCGREACRRFVQINEIKEAVSKVRDNLFCFIMC